MIFGSNSYREKEQSRQYLLIWMGTAGCAFSLANLSFGVENFFSGFAFGAMAGGPLAYAISNRHDEYLRSLLETAARWLCAAFGLYLLWLFLGPILDLSKIPNSKFLNNAREMLEVVSSQPLPSAIFLCSSFYAGFTFAWLRDKLGS